MTDTDIASLTRWIFKYQNTWEISDMTYWAKLAFAFMRPVFDEDRKDWEETSKTNSDNAKKRWDKRASETMRPHTTEYETMRPSTDIGIDSVIGIDIASDITETVSKDTGEQALVVFWKEWVNEVIQIIKESVEEMGWVYKASTRERQYANHIAEKHKDWWQFLEKRKDWKWNIDSIREIIYFSLNPNNSFVKQIINAEDFWNKWADVIMAMRREHIEKQKQHIEKTRHNPTGNPLLNF